jgi:saccharopepsin
LLDGELISHALFPKDTTKWQVEMESVSLIGSNNHGGKKVLVDKPLPHRKAFFMSLLPFLAFPYYLAQSLIDHIDSEPSGCCRFPVVDCDKVSSLPEINIGFKEQNVTLRGEDYVRKLKMLNHCPDIEEECHLMIDYLPKDEKLVILGMPFLEKVMGVWNWDEKTVFCESFLLQQRGMYGVGLSVVGELKK